MIQIIAGKKGKGKTKHLLDKVNAEVKEVHGNIVYLDKSSKHMYELNNKVRLIDTSEFGLSSSDGFIGFICGIISQDHDLEQMYLDSFLKIAKLEDADITETIDKLDELGEKYNITFVLSISLDADGIFRKIAKSKSLYLNKRKLDFLWMQQAIFAGRTVFRPAFLIQRKGFCKIFTLKIFIWHHQPGRCVRKY